MVNKSREEKCLFNFLATLYACLASPKTENIHSLTLQSTLYTNKIVNIEKSLFLHLLFTWWTPYSGLSRAIVEASLPNTVLIHTICATPCAYISYFVIWKLRSKIITKLNCRKILNFPHILLNWIPQVLKLFVSFTCHF